MNAKAVTKRSLLIQLVALFLFLLVGGFFSILVFASDGGDASRSFKSAVVILVFGRLAWQIYKHTFRFRDYFTYFAIVIGFCYLIDRVLGHILYTR